MDNNLIGNTNKQTLQEKYSICRVKFSHSKLFIMAALKEALTCTVKKSVSISKLPFTPLLHLYPLSPMSTTLALYNLQYCFWQIMRTSINQFYFTNLSPTGQRAVKSHQIASDRTYQRQTGSEYSLYVLLSLPQVQQPYPVQKTNDALIFMLPEPNDIKFI